MTPQEHYEAGQLTEAIAAANDAVKSHPTDVAKRTFLCELLCFAGELDRADTQFETIGRQRAEAALGVVMFRQLIRAEKSRQEFFADGRVPTFLGEPSPALKLALSASICIREGQLSAAQELLEEADEKRPRVSGTCDGETFDDLRDVDDLTAAFLEVLTSNGKYYWIPVERIDSISFPSPERPLDLLWRRATMDVRDGPNGEVFLPALYAGTHTEADDRVRLGRATDWRGEEGEPIRGIGQRIFLIGSRDRGILQLNEIKLDSSAG